MGDMTGVTPGTQAAAAGEDFLMMLPLRALDGIRAVHSSLQS
jgi:hypothetical protein